MIKKIIELIKRERRLLSILILFLTVYGIMTIFFTTTEGEKSESATVEEFRKTEKLWHEKMQEAEAFEKLMKEKPVAAVLFNLFSVLAIVGLGVGIAIDAALLFKPLFRSSISRTGPPVATPWSVRMLIRMVLTWAIVSFLFSMIFAVYRNAFIPEMSFHTAAIFHTTFMDVFSVLLIMTILVKNGGHWRDIGFWIRPKEWLREAGFGLLGYLAVLPLFFLVLLILVIVAQLLAYEPPVHPLVEIFLEEEKRSPVLIVYSLILAGVMGPVVEEIFFRGFFYRIIKEKWGVWAGMIITAAAFAFIHQNQFAFWPIFILGMALAYVYEKRDNIVAPITLHITHNCLFLGYFFVAKNVISQTGAS